jgi:hypothetical protein
MISNYAYDPRLHLQPVPGLHEYNILEMNFIFYIIEERQYSSSNMDDLIDSMARRHLAYRRLDVCICKEGFSRKSSLYFQVAIDRQQRGSSGGYGPYFGIIEILKC